MKYADHVVDLVGGTPLVRLNRVTEGIACTVLAKVEYLNPGGSVKDRIALRMIEAAEESGALRPGGTIVEPTSGNTGVGLALVAQRRGYACVFVCPDKVSEDKQNVLRAYGAQVVVCPTAVEPSHPDSYYSVSDRLVREIPGAWKPDQYSNPNGPLSHFESTGPEIWADTDGRVTHVVAGVGTGGTITGVARYLLQDILANVHAKLGQTDWVPGIVLTSAAVSSAWGYMLYTGDVSSIWPMFGVTNQALACLALAIGTTIILRIARKKRYALVTALPCVFMAVTSFAAGFMNIRLYLSRGMVLNAALSMVIIALVAVIIVENVRVWLALFGNERAIGMNDGRDEIFPLAIPVRVSNDTTRE